MEIVYDAFETQPGKQYKSISTQKVTKLQGCSDYMKETTIKCLCLLQSYYMTSLPQMHTSTEHDHIICKLITVDSSFSQDFEQ